MKGMKSGETGRGLDKKMERERKGGERGGEREASTHRSQSFGAV